MSILSFCCLMELMNVLDFRTYSSQSQEVSDIFGRFDPNTLQAGDVNDIPHMERLDCAYTRGLAIEVLRCIFSHFEITWEKGVIKNPWEQLYLPLLAQHVAVVLAYKTKTPTSVMANHRGCTLSQVKKQIELFTHGQESLKRIVSEIDLGDIYTLVWDGYDIRQVKKKSMPTPSGAS